MNVINKSKLLQKELPPALRTELEKSGIAVDSIWLCTDTDLNLSGSYETVYLVATAEDLFVIAAPSADYAKHIRRRLSRSEISEIRTRQGVGGGFLEATVDGIYFEVVAYSNARSDAFHKVASKLNHWQRGEKVDIGTADDFNPRRCAKCGIALQFKGDTCRRCVDRGAVLKRVLKFMRPYSGKAAVMVALVLVMLGLLMVPQKLMQLLTDVVLAPEQAGNPDLSKQSTDVAVGQWSFGVNTAMLWLLGLVAAKFATHFIYMLVEMAMLRLNSYVGTQITYDMRERVFGRLMQLSVDYYDRYNVGQLISRVSGDTEQMKGFVNQITTGFLQQILMLIMAAVLLFTLNWELALWTLVPAPLVLMGSVFFWKRVYPRYYRVWDSNSKLAGVLNTILSGVRVVKAFGQEGREERRFGRSSSYVRDSFRGIEFTVAWFSPSISMIFQLGGLIVWFVGGQMVLDGKAAQVAGGENHFTLGKLMQFLGYMGMFYQPLTHIMPLTNWLTGFMTATQRTFEILDTSVQVAESDNPIPVKHMKGSIVFENVTFGYDRHQPVLKNVSFEIAAGERIGIVGKSGSGKTTIINLLSRFYDVDDGRILIDGVDIREMCKDDLRRQIGVVLQEPFLFRGTIYDNLTYGVRDVLPEDVIVAAKAANCHDFIARHALGYDTYIGERGSGLSGGERQRISIARSLLYDPRILVLDEATSSVDTESEKLIQDALKHITLGRTSIAIAHRLSTLKNCDRILVVDCGKIAEQGSHADLIKAEGIYSMLVKIQTELSSEKSIDTLQANVLTTPVKDRRDAKK